MRITITTPDALAVYLLGIIGRYQWKDAPDSSAMPGQCERPTPRTESPVRFYPAFTPGGNSRKPLYPSRIHA